jgi:PAS domain S-box-containing protein
VEHDRDRRAKAAAERARRETEERLSLLLRATNDAVWDLDLVSGTLLVNGELLALIGHDPAGAPLTLDAWLECIHADDRGRVRGGLETVLRSGTSFWTDEYRLRRSDGSFARVADRALIMRNEKGRAIRVVGAIMDVTETQRLQEQLIQAQKMEAIGRLAGGVAHDFNNLLTGILVSTHLLEDARALTKDQLLEVTEIRKAAERASALTRQLLAFSRKQVMALTRLDLNETVRGVCTMLERTLGADIQLRLELADPPGTVRADAGQVEQILLNLAVNARDAMPDGGSLTLATARVDIGADTAADIAPGPYIALRVTDSGVGMDAATMDRIFEPFFTTKDVGRGTGLGLSTVYGIVRQHGGHIAVESQPGKGTTFTIHLPRVDGRAEAPVVEAPAAQHGGPERILLVEDDPGVQATIHRMLTRLGYKVLTAATAEEAWTAIQTHGRGIQLIVSDVQLAEGNGPALVARIREAGFDTPVVFLSGYAEEAVLPDGRLPDRSSFLAKPFTPATLAHRIRQALA